MIQLFQYLAILLLIVLGIYFKEEANNNPCSAFSPDKFCSVFDNQLYFNRD